MTDNVPDDTHEQEYNVPGRAVLHGGRAHGTTMLFCVPDKQMSVTHKTPWGWYIKTKRVDEFDQRIYQYVEPGGN